MDDTVYRELASVEGTHWWFQGRRRILRDVLRRRVAKGRPILDIGCGTGEMLDMLLEFGPVTGLDSSRIALDSCHQRFGERLHLCHGHIPDDLPASVGVVTAFDVVEHLEDDESALAAIHRCLTPGGVFICTVPALPFLWGAHDEVHHHFRRYTHRSLRLRLENAGFRVERITYFNTLLLPLAAAVRLGHRLSPSSSGGSDAALPRPWINRLLLHVFSAERWLLRVTSLPVGVSLLAVCTRPVLRRQADRVRCTPRTSARNCPV